MESQKFSLIDQSLLPSNIQAALAISRLSQQQQQTTVLQETSVSPSSSLSEAALQTEISAPQAHLQLLNEYENACEDPSQNMEQLTSASSANNQAMFIRERLVELMPDYPAIWSTSSRCYKDLNKKERSWLEISQKLNCAGELFL